MGLISESSETSLIQKKLKLAWIASKDIKLLTTDHPLLLDVWKSVKEESSLILSKIGNNFQEIKTAFKIIEFTMDPRISKEFDPTSCRLRYNLWTLLFGSSTDGETFFIPSFLTVATLIHEFNHYKFFSDHKLLGAPKEKQEEFNKQFGSELEKRAFTKEISFLKRCKEVLPKNFPVYVPTNIEWSYDGTFINPKIKVISVNRSKMIDTYIKYYENEIRSYLDQTTNKNNYDSESQKNAIKTHKVTSKNLRIPLKIRQSKNYPIIEVYF